ncbi:MAG: response regulator transcription factor [Acidobacteriota bacterium]
MSSPARVLLVDDQTLFREGLATLLSVMPDIEVVAEAENGAEGVALAAELRPDVVLMDLRMPVMSGVRATREILSRPDPPAVLVLTTFDDDDDVFQALGAGAAGYLLKDSPSERLLEAIRTVARGEPFLQSSITAKVLAGLQRSEGLHGSPTAASSAALAPQGERLSEREIEILRLIAEGLPNKAIAARLYLAEGTVKNYVSALLAKLEVRDRTQAALRARELGWI